MPIWVYQGAMALSILLLIVWLVKQFGPERIWVTLIAMLAGVGVIHLMTIIDILPQVIKE